ncbi:MAG: DUF6340 family protein [Prolixibacteraceae bacterium]|nr:DUF6340 family protein [Prolixibacteraceae bacterium]
MQYTFNKTYRIYFILLALIASSCSSVRYIPIEVADKPQEEIPENIQSLTLINRAVNPLFRNHQIDSLQNVFFKRRFALDTMILDTEVADTTLTAMGNLLFESGRFDIFIPNKRTIYSTSETRLPTSLSPEVIDSLTKAFNTDAVLSLDYLNTKVNTYYRNTLKRDPYAGEYYVYYANMEIAYEVMIRIYSPDNNKVIKTMTHLDTLFWEDYDYELRRLFDRFPKVKQAMIESGIHAALELSERISPVWRQENRVFFAKGHPMLVQATALIENSDWDGAMEMWRKVAETGNKSAKSKAEFNLALGYEMAEDFGTAIDWAMRSYNGFYRPITYEYLEILGSRKRKIEAK